MEPDTKTNTWPATESLLDDFPLTMRGLGRPTSKWCRQRNVITLLWDAVTIR